MNFPTDPVRQNDRLIDAFCEDLLNGGTGGVERVREIARQMRKVKK